MRISSLRPSPALFIAVGALVVALGGTSYAAAKISGSQIKKHTIAGNRLINNTLTGTQINESTLGTVPQAKHATTANTATTASSANTANTATSATSVDGQNVGTFTLNVAKDAAVQTLTLRDLVLKASCPGGAAVLTATGTVASGESLVASSLDAGSVGTTHDGSFTTEKNDAITPVSSTNGTATVIVTSSAASVTTITLGYETNTDQSCTFSGSGVQTG